LHWLEKATDRAFAVALAGTELIGLACWKEEAPIFCAGFHTGCKREA
jgi:hypothetical protein